MNEKHNKRLGQIAKNLHSIANGIETIVEQCATESLPSLEMCDVVGEIQQEVMQEVFRLNSLVDSLEDEILNEVD